MDSPASFVHIAHPSRVVAGARVRARIGEEVARAGITRALVVSSPEQVETARTVAAFLAERVADVLPVARQHVPVEVVAQARRRVDDLAADGCVAVGGGSAIGLAKALALDPGLPYVALPTTYAGSEMTDVWGLTEGNRKTTGRDRRVLPAAVLYDPELTTSLPPAATAASGLNAIAHAAEALYAPDRSPLVTMLAVAGIRALAAALPALAVDGSDLDARAEAQYGAWLCGTCLGATTMSLHHSVCHALGGIAALPHAPVHAVVLPHVLGFVLPGAPQARAALAEAFSDPDPVAALQRLTRRLGLPHSLAELGMPEDMLGAVVDAVLERPYGAGAMPGRTELGVLLRAAWAGQAPSGSAPVTEVIS